MEEIKERSDNIIFLDFEDTAVLNAIPDEMALLNYIDNHRIESLCYVFLDEVQRVEGWAGGCRTLRIRNCSVFISDSNSKLLSREFTKELSGRYVPFRIRPFVYRELAEYGKELGKDISLTDYIIWGGFPKRIEYCSEDGQRIYLNELNETIILNDIINRYKIRKTEVFKRLSNFVFLSNGRILSARSAEKYMRGAGLPCSITTITRHIGYLEEAYAIGTVKKYSAKSKSELEYYLKVYDEDVALNSIRVMNNRYDLTHNFENVVYNELLYMGYYLQVYHDGAQEIDFVAISRLHTLWLKRRLMSGSSGLLQSWITPVRRLLLRMTILISAPALCVTSSSGISCIWTNYDERDRHMRFLVSRHLRVYHYGEIQRNKLCDAYNLSKTISASILPE